MGVPLDGSCAGGMERDTHTIMAAEGRKALTQLCRQRTRTSGTNGAAVDADYGYDFCPCPSHEAFISRIQVVAGEEAFGRDRKSTRLNSSH